MGETKEYIGAFPKEDRIIFLILLILLALAPLVPWPKLSVTQATIDSYDAVENVPDGGVFMWTTDFSMSTWFEMEPPETAIFKHFFKRAQDDGCKVVLTSTYTTPEGWFAQQKVVAERAKPSDFGLTYGEDWMMTGWIPGYEPILKGLLADFWATCGGKDYAGTPLGNLPMMANIKGAGDFHLVGYSTSTSPDPYCRQWGVGVGVNNVKVDLKSGEADGAQLIGSMGTATVPWIMPYIESGVHTSYVSGQRGGAEYEQIAGTPGTGLGFMGGQSIGHFYAIVLIIGTNVLYLQERRR
jgi:hypothetical protein